MVAPDELASLSAFADDLDAGGSTSSMDTGTWQPAIVLL